MLHYELLLDAGRRIVKLERALIDIKKAPESVTATFEGGS
jgi:hypothetical protein